MTVTVSTSLDGSPAPAAVSVDLTSAVQAARAFAAQAQSYLEQASVVLEQAQQAEAGAQLAYDQAQALYQLSMQKLLTQFQSTLLQLFQSLPTTVPAQPGQLWNDTGTLALS